MRVVVAGGSGLVGTRLCARLERSGHRVVILTRQQGRGTQSQSVAWSGQDQSEIEECIGDADAVIHLAGANVGDQKWSKPRKDLIRSSRLQTGRTLAQAVKNSKGGPSVFVQASAVGYYGNLCGPERLTENMPSGDDFLADVCVQWEESTVHLEEEGVRHVIARLGVVLSGDGGALPRMSKPFQFGMGAPLGDGKQPFPWIHEEDAAGALQFLVENEDATGPYNLTAPAADNNEDFSRALSAVLNRPLLPSIPGFVLRLAFGEMADILLCGQNASSQKLSNAGYEFAYQDAQSALKELFP